MSTNPAAIFALGLEAAKQLDPQRFQTVLQRTGFDHEPCSENGEDFEEDQPPYRRAATRKFRFGRLVFEAGLHCLTTLFHCYDWKYLPDHPEVYTQVERLLRELSKELGNTGPIIVFPDCNLDYDDLLLLSPVASFEEVLRKVHCEHGDPSNSLEDLLQMDGQMVGMIVSSGYLVINPI